MDSFGNRNAILSTPMIYDGLFMDMVVDDGCNAAEIAGSCEKSGAGFLSSSAVPKINLQGRKDLPDELLFSDKPIQPEH